MTKLNLSALKKQAGNISTKILDTSNISSIPLEEKGAGEITVASLAEITQAVGVTEAASVTIIQSLPPVEVRDEATISVREFFPNLTVSTKYEMDDMAVTPPDSQQEIVTNEIKVNLHLPESNSPVISESETVFEVVNPVTEKEMESTSVLDLQSTPSVLEPISSGSVLLTGSAQDTVYVQSVAEDLSKVREGGLTRLSSGKKVALVSISGILICVAVFAGLYSFGIFPASKASVIEAVSIPSAIPAIITVSTGTINTETINTGATATGVSTFASTGTVILTSSGTATNYSGSLVSIPDSNTVLSESPLPVNTIITSTNTGSESGNILTGTGVKTNTGEITIPTKIVEASAFTGETISSVRTPNIRILRTE